MNKTVASIIHEVTGLHVWQYGALIQPADDYGRTCIVCGLDQEFESIPPVEPLISDGEDLKEYALQRP